MNDKLVEALADYEHDRWSRWQKHVFDKSIKNEDGTYTIPSYLVERWQREINTEYNDLSESEKESDRKEARLMLECIDKINSH